MTITYQVKDAVYVNLTNRCPCNCTFCLRQNGSGVFGSGPLWLEREPTLEETVESLGQWDFTRFREVVFCGYGEPTERLDVLLAVATHLKGRDPSLRVRVNTNGLANLIHGKDITPELEGRFDTVSISLNAPDAKEFLALTRSKFGIQSFDAIKEFAVLAKRYVPNVVMTVVEKVMPEEKIEACRKICEELGVTLRVRPFEE